MAVITDRRAAKVWKWGCIFKVSGPIKAIIFIQSRMEQGSLCAAGDACFLFMCRVCQEGECMGVLPCSCCRCSSCCNMPLIFIRLFLSSSSDPFLPFLQNSLPLSNIPYFHLLFQSPPSASFPIFLLGPRPPAPPSSLFSLSCTLILLLQSSFSGPSSPPIPFLTAMGKLVDLVSPARSQWPPTRCPGNNGRSLTNSSRWKAEIEGDQTEWLSFSYGSTFIKYKGMPWGRGQTGRTTVRALPSGQLTLTYSEQKWPPVSSADRDLDLNLCYLEIFVDSPFFKLFSYRGKSPAFPFSKLW